MKRNKKDVIKCRRKMNGGYMNKGRWTIFIGIAYKSLILGLFVSLFFRFNYSMFVVIYLIFLHWSFVPPTILILVLFDFEVNLIYYVFPVYSSSNFIVAKPLLFVSFYFLRKIIDGKNELPLKAFKIRFSTYSNANALFCLVEYLLFNDKNLYEQANKSNLHLRMYSLVF